ncbi:MAG: 4'-phosphopantetheinyl transferase [Jatrophihabitantaceae bacterium]
MIASILPDWVASCARTTDVGEDELFPDEQAVLAKAVPKRRAEFSTVRACARQALAQLGIAPVPILPGERGAPRWPDGVVGSMTHCDGYRAAAVAPASRAVGIGVDAEPHGPLPDGVLRLVSRPEELPRLRKLTADQPAVHWDRLLFTIKESVYKVWFPITRSWLDFAGASVRIEPAEQRFTVELQVPGPIVNGAELTELTGRFLIADGLMVSAIVLDREPG